MFYRVLALFFYTNAFLMCYIQDRKWFGDFKCLFNIKKMEKKVEIGKRGEEDIIKSWGMV